MTETCTECGRGWLVTYKSRRSHDGAFQTQYTRCWACQATGKRVIPAGPPKRNRCTNVGTDMPQEALTTQPAVERITP